MCERADQIIALIDSTKIAKKSLSITVPIEKIDILITDSGTSSEFIDKLINLDIDVRVVNKIISNN
jgi:DeoR/GlpR family transcriptional regulator of sugar metabolism